MEIIWPVNAAQVARHIKVRHKMEHDPHDTFGAKLVTIDRKDGTDVQIICLRTFDSGDPSDIAMLAHEVFHCADHILARRGVELQKGTTEPYAYLIESIMRRSLNLLCA